MSLTPSWASGVSRSELLRTLPTKVMVGLAFSVFTISRNPFGKVISAGAEGAGGPLLLIPAGGARQPSSVETVETGKQYIHMDGRSVFKWAVRVLADGIALVLEQAGLGVNDVGLYLLHQANIRIIAAAVEQLGLPPEKVFNNIHRYGNTSAGSVPIALDEAVRAGRVKPGQIVLMSGFGAGLTWGTALFRW